jgi:signal transduction histidine kinase/CheY-like chemotaxis protein
MMDHGSLPDDGAELRKRAEEIAREKAAQVPDDLLTMTSEEMRRILHELRVHQIELEMQNEELRSAQASLDASRARYFDLYDLAPVGYVTVSDRGLVLEANLTAAKLLSVIRGDLVRQPISRFIFAEDQDIYYRTRQKLLENGEPQTCELRMLKRDPRQTKFWGRLDTTVSQLETGETVHRIAFSDISEKKHADEGRQKLQEQLNQAQKLESVGRLAGGVAHDFNNMLSVIIGNTELAMDNMPLANPLYDPLCEIANAARHSADVTRQLLAFARKQIVSPKILDMNETMAGILRVLRRLIGEDISLAWLPGGQLWQVKMDPFQLDQVLTNLCVNARDAIDGIGTITIETENVILDEANCADHAGLIPGNFVLLTVRDDGCGMAPDTLNNIFEPFFTTKDTAKGTGLGLATVYGIVTQNKGLISVASEPGKGSTFKIYIPRYEMAATPISQPPASKSGEERGSATILLVEDEPAILKVSLMMLQRLGYNVVTATTPGEAIRLVEAYPKRIDLLLTDVIMPEMNGRDLAKRLTAMVPEMKRIFMSGYSANVIAEGGILDSKMHFIQKPFSMWDLASKVREVLATHE